MQKIEEDAIKCIVAIIIGLFAIFILNQLLAGLILIAISIVIFGVNENLRGFLLSSVKWLWEKIHSKEIQSMNDSPGGLQQQATGDAIVAKMVHKGDIKNYNYHYNGNPSNKSKRASKRSNKKGDYSRNNK